MGSQIFVERGTYPAIYVEVYGTDDLDFIEVLRWDSRLGRREFGHPVFEIIHRINGQGPELNDKFIDSTYAGSSIYYVRVKQKRPTLYAAGRISRQVWAWSSPIWVKAPGTLDTADIVPVPRELRLRQNSPNPFDRSTAITYYLPEGGKVEATLYNVFGQRVRSLLNDFQSAGWHGLQLSASGLAQGVYFVRLEAAGQVLTQKIILMR